MLNVQLGWASSNPPDLCLKWGGFQLFRQGGSSWPNAQPSCIILMSKLGNTPRLPRLVHGVVHVEAHVDDAVSHAEHDEGGREAVPLHHSCDVGLQTIFHKHESDREHIYI